MNHESGSLTEIVGYREGIRQIVSWGLHKAEITEKCSYWTLCIHERSRVIHSTWVSEIKYHLLWQHILLCIKHDILYTKSNSVYKTEFIIFLSDFQNNWKSFHFMIDFQRSIIDFLLIFLFKDWNNEWNWNGWDTLQNQPDASLH